MSNLRPEVRVNKNGVPVIKHVRDERAGKKSLLSRIAPFISRNIESEEDKTRRQEMTHDLVDLYSSSYSEFMNRIEESYPSSKAERQKAKVELFFKEQSRETLAVIHASYAGVDGDSLRSFVDNMQDEPESIIRSYALYQHCGVPTYDWEKLSQDISASLDIDDIGNLAYGGAEHEQVSTVIFWAKAMRTGRTLKFHKERGKYRDWTDVNSENRLKESSIVQMTPSLASIALEYPERFREVVDYMTERDLTPESFDEEHLRLTLDSASKPLNNGVL